MTLKTKKNHGKKESFSHIHYTLYNTLQKIASYIIHTRHVHRKGFVIQLTPQKKKKNCVTYILHNIVHIALKVQCTLHILHTIYRSTFFLSITPLCCLRVAATQKSKKKINVKTSAEYFV